MKKNLVITFGQKFIKDSAKSQNISKEYEKRIKLFAKERIKHFETDKWDLDYNILISDLFIELLGFNPEWHFIDEVWKKVNVEIRTKNTSFGEKRSMMSLVKPKQKVKKLRKKDE